MLKQAIGIITMCLGGMMGDSDYLIIPVVIMLIGAWLIVTGRGDM